jgi:hypothetical protein
MKYLTSGFIFIIIPPGEVEAVVSGDGTASQPPQKAQRNALAFQSHQNSLA